MSSTDPLSHGKDNIHDVVVFPNLILASRIIESASLTFHQQSVGLRRPYPMLHECLSISLACIGACPYLCGSCARHTLECVQPGSYSSSRGPDQPPSVGSDATYLVISSSIGFFISQSTRFRAKARQQSKGLSTVCPGSRSDLDEDPDCRIIGWRSTPVYTLLQYSNGVMWCR